jgi:TolB-like protein/tRNA A-37 threonylcarbamoyl transferase component Bud32
MTLLDDVTRGLAGLYRIDREVGRGGMATVYLAHDLRHDRQVALKLLVPQLAAQLSDERFVREIRVIAGLSHPHILPLLDSGRLDAGAGSSAGQPWFVMPFVAGESLRVRLDRERQLPMEFAARIIREVAAALDFAHAHGVVHRDIKPENILLFEGRAMVADFGIARALDAEAERMTATGMIVGTPTYMSPEQAAGDASLDGRSDQYALACVLYEMLTGAPPFSGATAQALIARHALDTPSPVRTIRPEVAADVDVDAVLRRGMAKSPADRYATSSEFARALTAPAGVAAGWMSGGRSRMLLVLLGAASVAALAVTYRARDVGRTNLASAPSNRTRVAVLPLRSVSPDPADQYFADGMTDEIAGTLASIGELRVIARSSLGGFAHAGTRTTADVARELDVGSIVGGSVRKDGNHLRIAIELSDARTGEARWQHTYDKTLTDVFAIQRDVALAVAGALRVALVARDSSQVSKQPTADTAAYDAYLRATVLADKGRYRPDQRAALDTAIVLLRRAVRQDSGFAPAWAALGEDYTRLIFSGGAPAAYRDSARHAVNRALQIDPLLAEGYAARSNLAYTKEAGWRIADALHDLLYAVSLKPSDVDARASLASLTAHIGLLRESQRELAGVLAIDPVNAFVRLRVPRVLWQQQQFPAALATFARDRQAGWKTNIPEESLVLGYLGRASEGLRLLDEKATSADTSGDVEAARGVLLARLGRLAEARVNLARSEHLGGGRSHFHHASFMIATAHAIMGEKEEATRWLERTAGDGMPAYDLFAGDPTLVTLKGTPTFDALMRRLRSDSEQYRKAYRESR